jgi:hypothetical protein
MDGLSTRSGCLWLLLLLLPLPPLLALLSNVLLQPGCHVFAASEHRSLHAFRLLSCS